MATNKPLATLIGDVVGSREQTDRRRLQRSLNAALETINERVDAVQPLEPTIGDEFQGAFSTVASAARASLLIRLQLLKIGGPDSRYGLGFGPVAVFDELRTPRSQDGPGWWSARDAIQRAKRLEQAPRTSFVRTCFGSSPAEGATPGIDLAMDAFLICRDAGVARMNDRQRRLLLGLMLGLGQAQLAADEGITQGAVSQNLQRSGAYAIDAAQQRLDGEPQ